MPKLWSLFRADSIVQTRLRGFQSVCAPRAAESEDPTAQAPETFDPGSRTPTQGFVPDPRDLSSNVILTSNTDIHGSACVWLDSSTYPCWAACHALVLLMPSIIERNPLKESSLDRSPQDGSEAQRPARVGEREKKQGRRRAGRAMGKEGKKTNMMLRPRRCQADLGILPFFVSFSTSAYIVVFSCSPLL